MNSALLGHLLLPSLNSSVKGNNTILDILKASPCNTWKKEKSPFHVLHGSYGSLTSHL
ncbi:hypothetical protein NIES2107_38890 [Nostoc carneum NIES-2107]|nr:hypothetical protein NIES2107_38890 [Nostoc carneum NIES-2107]